MVPVEGAPGGNGQSEVDDVDRGVRGRAQVPWIAGVDRRKLVFAGLIEAGGENNRATGAIQSGLTESTGAVHELHGAGWRSRGQIGVTGRKADRQGDRGASQGRVRCGGEGRADRLLNDLDGVAGAREDVIGDDDIEGPK